MPRSKQPENPIGPQDAESAAKEINKALVSRPDKDWNYSRITLVCKQLRDIAGPYILWYELINPQTKEGRSLLKAVVDEVGWGERHSNELGILEIVSLRANRALLEATTDGYWGENRPVLRVERKEVLERQNVNAALWYEVQEVSGEDFENR